MLGEEGERSRMGMENIVGGEKKMCCEDVLRFE
jgi:hypothetical protein